MICFQLRKEVAWRLLILMVLSLSMGKVYGEDLGDEEFSADFDEAWLGVGPTVNLSSKKWEFALSGGPSIITSVNTSIDTPPANNLSFTTGNQMFSLNFPARSFAVDSFGNGYDIQAQLVRRVNDFVGLGFQGGAAFDHSNTVENGSIPFLQFDSMGNLISSTIVNYDINYEASVYHFEPIVRLGNWIRAGRYAWKPHIIAGCGVAGIEEKAVLHVEGQDFDLGTKSTTAFGVIGGGGLDFRVSPTGVIGVEYQMQRIFVSPHNWTLSLPTARFAYLF